MQNVSPKLHLPVQLSQVVVGIDVLRRVPDRLQEVVLCRTKLDHQRPDVVVGTGIGWPQAQGLAVVHDGVLRLGRIAQIIPEIVVHFGVVG